MNWVAFQLVMHFDAAINPYSAFGRWCLPRAGAWAYRHHVGDALNRDERS